MIFMWVFVIGAALQTAAGSGTKGLNMIYVGRVIAGVGIGAISAVSPAYVSECAPKEVRGRITGLFQIWVAVGVLISYFVNCESSLPTKRSSVTHSTPRIRWYFDSHSRRPPSMAYSLRYPVDPWWNHGFGTVLRP